MPDRSSIHLTLWRRRRRVQLRIERVPQHLGEVLVEAQSCNRDRIDVRIVRHENLRVECDVDQAPDRSEGAPAIDDIDGKVADCGNNLSARMLDGHRAYFSEAVQTRPPSFAPEGYR